MRLGRGQSISHDQIRQMVTNNLTDMERSIIHEVDRTNSGWADRVELYKFATEFNIKVVVCDDDHGTITIHGPKSAARTLVLRLFECHYTPVFCESVRLLKLFETHDCVSKDNLKQHFARQISLGKRAWKFLEEDEMKEKFSSLERDKVKEDEFKKFYKSIVVGLYVLKEREIILHHVVNNLNKLLDESVDVDIRRNVSIFLERAGAMLRDKYGLNRLDYMVDGTMAPQHMLVDS